MWDVQRFRRRSDEVDRCARQTAEEDGRRVPIYIERGAGVSGKAIVLHYQRDVLAAMR